MSRLETQAVLTTPRLTLRPPRRADAPRLAALAGDYDVARMTTRMPHPYHLSDAERFLAHCETRDPGRDQVLAITTSEDGLIGMIGVHSQQTPPPSGRATIPALGPEIGYWLGKPWWGRGLATEAAQAVLGLARRGAGRKVLVSGHFADNPASGGVLTKAGFLYTGVVEDRYSLSRGQPVPTRMMVWLA